jgi:uncharacterized membrane protein YedE/YeeE
MDIILWGFLFGAILQYARLNRFETIAGMAVLQNFCVAKTIAFAIGLGALLLQAEMQLGWADYHLKPVLMAGVIIGGLVFGVGMAILGYCPGTVVISVGQGNVDALIGILGGLCGSGVYALLYPSLSPLLGPDLGKLSIQTLSAGHQVLSLVVGIGLPVVFMGTAVYLQRFERNAGWRWLYAAIGIAVLNAFLISSFGGARPMGASSAFPYAAMAATGMLDGAYWPKISSAGAWEMEFLLGAFLAGLVFSVLQGTFRITRVPRLWAEYYGSDTGRRLSWSFIGGFLLLFGARMAGGCTSGHIISGGMQLAVSSLLFGMMVFAAFLTTGHFFYRVRGKSAESAAATSN